MRTLGQWRTLGALSLFLALAGGTGTAAMADEATNRAPTGVSTNLWFPVGEELVYNIYWGVVPVGSSRVTTEWIEENGKRLIAIRYRTRTNKVVEKLYPVNDFVESVIEPETFLPLRFVKRLSEGRYRVDEVTTFDHRKLTAHWESKLKGKTKDFAIEPDTRDVVALMYYLRRRSFAPGQKEHYRLMADEKLYDLWVNPLKVESVSLPVFEDVPSVKVEPEAAFQGFFLRQGRAWIWVSEDSRRVCTKLVGSVPLANIKVLLAEVRGPGDDFYIKAMKKAGQSTQNVDDKP